MALPGWFQPGELYSYLVVGGVGLIIIAVLLYFLPLRQMKLPGILAGSLGGLAVGFGLGVGALLWAGYHKEQADRPSAPAEGGGPAGNPAMARFGGGGMMPRGGGPGRGGRGRGGPGDGRSGRGPGGGPAPTARSQLASLIIKLDLLTHPPLAAQLTSEEKAKLAQQLKGLDDPAKPLSEEEAKTTLDSLTAALEKHKQTLEEAGFRWPGQSAASPPGADAGNPLQDKKVTEHLKSLQKAL